MQVGSGEQICDRPDGQLRAEFEWEGEVTQEERDVTCLWEGEVLATQDPSLIYGIHMLAVPSHVT